MKTPIISNSSSISSVNTPAQTSKWEGREVVLFVFQTLSNVPRIIKVAIFILSTIFLYMAAALLKHTRVKVVGQNSTLLPSSTSIGSIPSNSSSSPTSAQVATVASLSRFEQDFNKIKEDYEAIFSDLRRLHDSFGSQFASNLNAFETKYGSLRETDSTLEKAFSHFDHIRKTHEYLKKLKTGLFIHEPRMDKDNLFDIPQDGNCLFHTLLLGVIQFEEQLLARGKLKERIVEHSILRNECVTWMKQNYHHDTKLQSYIAEAIEAYKVLKGKVLHDELESCELSLEFAEGSEKESAYRLLKNVREEIQTLQNLSDVAGYFALVEQNGFFASIAEIYAFSKMFEMTIEISRQFGGKTIHGFDPPVSPEYSDRPGLHIVNVNGNHFTLYCPTHS